MNVRFLICIGAFSGLSAAAESVPVKNLPKSPDGIVLAEVKGKDGSKFELWDEKNRKKVSAVLDGVSMRDPHFVLKWNPAGSAVAMCVDYGVKSSVFVVLERTDKGNFTEVDSGMPDCLDAYEEEHGKPFALKDAAEVDILDVGSWLSGDTVELMAAQSFSGKEQITLVCTFRLKIRDGKGDLSGIRLSGPFDEEQFARFRKKWHGDKK